MKILLSNDDGYLAPGLKCLAEAVDGFAEVTVVAPDINRSGASHSLTLSNPVRAVQVKKDFYHVSGTPADCVYVAIHGLLQNEPDMVIAGINAGANLGDDALYSGTIAAATEGRFLGMPAMAVSLTGIKLQHYETAAKVVLKMLHMMKERPLPGDTILNINVPDLSWEEIQGFEATRLGHRQRPDPIVKDEDPYGREIFWIGPSGPEEDAGPGTDFFAIQNGCVSVSPLKIDMTSHAEVPEIGKWLNNL
jgi:5'-nucleotidase